MTEAEKIEKIATILSEGGAIAQAEELSVAYNQMNTSFELKSNSTDNAKRLWNALRDANKAAWDIGGANGKIAIKLLIEWL